MAVYDPTLMLQPVAGLEGAGYWFAVVYIVVKAALAMSLWGFAAVGYFLTPLSWWERIWAALAAGLLVAALPITDEVGFALAALFAGYHVWRSEEHTAELQSRQYLVCRLLLEKN